MTSISAEEISIRAAGAALGRARLHDDRVTSDDAGRVAVWAEAFQPYAIKPHEALNAVTSYYSEPRDRVIGTGDVIRIVRNSRQDIAQRDTVADAAGELTPPDPQLGGLPIDGANGRAIPAAYEINNAIDRDCPTCKAPADHWCVNLIDRTCTRKIPCLKRMKLVSPSV